MSGKLTLPELYAHLDNPPPAASKEEVASELSERLVNAVSILILPSSPFPSPSARGAASAASVPALRWC